MAFGARRRSRCGATTFGSGPDERLKDRFPARVKSSAVQLRLIHQRPRYRPRCSAESATYRLIANEAELRGVLAAFNQRVLVQGTLRPSPIVATCQFGAARSLSSRPHSNSDRAG